MSETEEDLQRYIDREQNPLVIGLARELLDARAEIERLRDALRPLTFAVEQEHGASYRQLIINAHAAMDGAGARSSEAQA